MEKGKNLGIWMDHSNANIMELTAEPIKTIIITSKFNHAAKEHSLSKNENLMHNKEQHQQSEYYNTIGEIIKNYKDVVIFGPTNAKAELHNLLKANHLFEDIKIKTEQADKMTENQQHAYVRDYFSHR